MSQIVWLASYPKSGNTWLRLLLRALGDDADTPELMTGINESLIASNREVFERVTGLVSSELTRDEAERMRPAVYRQLAAASPQEVIMKVHDRFDSPAVGGVADFPAELTQAVVYLVRDPRDVCVSFAHHLGLTVEQTLARMLSESLYLDSASEPLVEQLPQWLGRWDRHVHSWARNPLLDPIIVRYEDLLSDPQATLASVLAKLHWDFSDDRIQSAIQRCQFDRLVRAESTAGFAERPDPSTRFFRSGKSGGWSESLCAEQARTIGREFGSTMRDLGYDPDESAKATK